jgi:hypothetical protein
MSGKADCRIQFTIIQVNENLWLDFSESVIKLASFSKTASIPASARPDSVVRSGTSLSDVNFIVMRVDK